jgi:cation diffusion facilitator CzcD-associated flavoprotein CzcO
MISNSGTLGADQEHYYFDVVVVGAGFAGLYALYRLRERGLRVAAIESAPDVGGVWYHNCYPGARCDLLSIDYSYSFSEELQREWRWSHRYAEQSEILAYLRHVADRFHLRPAIFFNTTVTGMTRDDALALWSIQTNEGSAYQARFVVLATGPLSVPKDPDFPGYETFAGEKLQASRWPKQSFEFEGKRVAVIGTGSSGVQTITEVAKRAHHLVVYQRTPTFTAPARNRPIEPVEYDRVIAEYPARRARMKNSYVGAYMFSSDKRADECSPAEQRAILDACWAEGGLGYVSAFSDVLLDEAANTLVADYLREKMGELVTDPVVREKLMPHGFPVGARRPCCDSGYLETFNRANVELVDLRETPLVRFTPDGIVTSDGLRSFDMVIVALGFDALTGAPLAIDPVNGTGLKLSEAWRHGPNTYLGMTVASFPNLFLMNSPGATSVFGNVPIVSEHEADWIADCIGWIDSTGKTSIQATVEAQDQWTSEVSAIGEQTLIMKAPSWYSGGNIPGKKRRVLAYLGGLDAYAARCRQVAESGYIGFVAM